MMTVQQAVPHYESRPTPFCRWLTYERTRLGLSQAALALAVEGFYGKQAVTKLEVGVRRPTPEQIHRLNMFFWARGGSCF